MQKSGEAEIWAPVARFRSVAWVSMGAASESPVRWMEMEMKVASAGMNMLMLSFEARLLLMNGESERRKDQASKL